MNRDEGFGRRQILSVRGVCGYFVDLGILGIKWTWSFMNVSMLRVKGIPFVRMRNGYTGLIEKKKKNSVWSRNRNRGINLEIVQLKII